MGSKGSSKTERSTGALTDFISGWTSAGADFKIQLTNLVTNWNKIVNKPDTFPFDMTQGANITGHWYFTKAVGLTSKTFLSFGSVFNINLHLGSDFYLEPNTNFTMGVSVIYPAAFMIVIKQPPAGGIEMTLKPDKFMFEAIPTLSVVGNSVDVLICKYSDTLERVVITHFIKGVVLN